MASLQAVATVKICRRLPWQRTLCEKVLEETGLDLYRALACLTLEFLESERRHVPESNTLSERRLTCETQS